VHCWRTRDNEHPPELRNEEHTPWHTPNILLATGTNRWGTEDGSNCLVVIRKRQTRTRHEDIPQASWQKDGVGEANDRFDVRRGRHALWCASCDFDEKSAALL
jgi:hypothetical protein